jgi:hypothetical protein
MDAKEDLPLPGSPISKISLVIGHKKVVSF